MELASDRQSMNRQNGPAVLLASQLLVCYVWIKRPFLCTNFMGKLPYIPFLDSFNIIPNFIFNWLIHPLFVLVSIIVLIRPKWNIATSIVGFILLLSILSSAPQFSNILMLTTCLLIIIGVGAGRPKLIRIQLSIMYFGAFLNKVLDVDWLNGRFFHTMATIHEPIPFYMQLSESFDEFVLGTIIGIMVIAIEFVLAILFSISRYTKTAIVIGFGFHLAMMLTTFAEFSYRFLFVFSAAYLCLLPFKDRAFHFGRAKKYEISKTRLIFGAFITFLLLFDQGRGVQYYWRLFSDLF